MTGFMIIIEEGVREFELAVNAAIASLDVVDIKVDQLDYNSGIKFYGYITYKDKPAPKKEVKKKVSKKKEKIVKEVKED